MIDLLTKEETFYSDSVHILCGVDEAGRGPLAGPVCAAAVILPRGTVIEGLNDSKKLSEKKREQLFDVICDTAVSYAIAFATVEEIEELNILHAAHAAELNELIVVIGEGEGVLLKLFLELLRLLLVKGLLGLFDKGEHIAHAEDTACHPVGMEGLDLVELFARAGELNRLSGDRSDGEGGSASRVAVELR